MWNFLGKFKEALQVFLGTAAAAGIVGSVIMFIAPWAPADDLRMLADDLYVTVADNYPSRIEDQKAYIIRLETIRSEQNTPSRKASYDRAISRERDRLKRMQNNYMKLLKNRDSWRRK